MTITYTDALTEVQDMRQIELPRWGEANLSITTAARPKPGPGQVLVQMKAISLNFRDLLVINGLYNPKMPLPLVPVSDGAGVIVERGPGAEKLREGALVMPIHVPGWTGGRPEPDAAPRGGPGPGVLAEYVVFDEGELVEAPGHLDAIEASTLPCAAVTAWNGLFGGPEPVRPGDRVLILGTGGVVFSPCSSPSRRAQRSSSPRKTTPSCHGPPRWAPTTSSTTVTTLIGAAPRADCATTEPTSSSNSEARLPSTNRCAPCVEVAQSP